MFTWHSWKQAERRSFAAPPRPSHLPGRHNWPRWWVDLVHPSLNVCPIPITACPTRPSGSGKPGLARHSRTAIATHPQLPPDLSSRHQLCRHASQLDIRHILAPSQGPPIAPGKPELSDSTHHKLDCQAYTGSRRRFGGFGPVRRPAKPTAPKDSINSGGSGTGWSRQFERNYLVSHG